MSREEYEYKIKNSKLLTYDLKVRHVVSNVVRWWEYKDTEVVGIIIYNLLACVRKGSVLVYSRMAGGKATKSRKNVTVGRVIKAVDFLEREGYIVNHKGRGSPIVENRIPSWIEPTDKFLQQWPSKEVYMQAEIDYLEQNEVLELRDVTKNAMQYRNSEHIQRMADVVRSLNTMNEGSEVRDGEGQILTNIYCRIFNESFELGGRFYRADVLQIKNKDNDARLDITIDGKQVCEVDYSNLHFRIAAAQQDIDTEDIPLDVYSGILEDEQNPVDRRIVKLAVNMMFNCTSKSSARSAIQKAINTMSQDDKSKYTLGLARSVMELIFSAYPDFLDFFCEPGSFGRALQNADSHLASDILEVMVSKGITCLPVHDSFIVSIDHMDFLCDTMGEAFRNRFGVTSVVPVGVKYKINGVVTEDKICV
jgi:uncharacterized protein YkuJ